MTLFHSKQLKKIDDLVITGWRLRVYETVEAMGILHAFVVSILSDCWGIRSSFVRWVQRLYVIDHKQNRVTTSKKHGFTSILWRSNNKRNSGSEKPEVALSAKQAHSEHFLWCGRLNWIWLPSNGKNSWRQTPYQLICVV